MFACLCNGIAIIRAEDACLPTLYQWLVTIDVEKNVLRLNPEAVEDSG